MEKQFNGDRLKKARIYRGMTVVDLAEKLELQRQTVSGYESGKSTPNDSTITQKISNALDFPVQFFLEKDSELKIGSTYFRALLTTKKKYRAEQILRMEFIAGIYSFLKEYIEFPEINIPNCDGCTPEEAAVKLREAWGLGNKPIANLIHLVEQNGILVTSYPTTTNDIDAFSQMFMLEEEMTHFIGFSNNKTSASRIHFDIAHELGHICLHDWTEDVEALEKEDFKERETEANRFASAFLLPEDSFCRDIRGKNLNVPYYTEIKKKWFVSIQAMHRRAYNLGVIDMDAYQYTLRILQRRGLRKQEPLDDVLLTATPSLLKTSVLLLLQENVFTPKEFMEELSLSFNLSLSAKEVEFLLDLPKDTLTVNNIIPFHALRLKDDGEAN